ncbi:MAG TPA: OmpW family outer membrane protein [Albitalea sp.]|nr:OmpW family outer membrane protein [Albitalea sp.]
MTHHLKCIAFAAAAFLCAGSAQAQSAGSWLARVGATKITPHVNSGDLSAPSLGGTKVDIKSDTQLSGGITYMVTDNFAVDLPLSLPFKHEIVGDGAIAGVGKIGETRALPITLLAQYRFLDAQAKFRPYVEAGATYAKFYKEKSTATLSALTGGTPANPTTLKVDSKLAATFGIGASMSVAERCFVSAGFTKTLLKTRATLSTGQTLDAKLDPTSVSIAVGYRF